MELEQKHFRTATFGGFQKKDVLDYLSDIIEKHNRHRADLQSSLESMQDDMEALESQKRDTEEALASITQKNAELLEKLGEMTLAQEALEQKLSKAEEAEHEYAKARIDFAEEQQKSRMLTLRIQSMEEQNEQHRLAKEKLPEIELKAYQRAEEIEQKALEEAKHIRLQSAELIVRLKKNLEPVYQEGMDYLDHVSEELLALRSRVEAGIGGIAEVMDSLDEVMVGELSKNASDAPSERMTLDDLILQTETLGHLEGR